MAKDPAFLFYPGDYLRDTAHLTDVQRSMYDTIMCRHMKKICFTYEDLHRQFRNSDPDDIQELVDVMEEVSPGEYSIEWVRDSIEKRRAYSESRRKNRAKREEKKEKINEENEKDMNNICKTHVVHMENEIENENKEVIKIVKTAQIKKNEDAPTDTPTELDPGVFESVPAYGKIRIDWESQRGFTWGDDEETHCRGLVRKIKMWLRSKENYNPTESEIYGVYATIADTDNWWVTNHFSIAGFNKNFSKIVSEIQIKAAAGPGNATISADDVLAGAGITK